VAKAPGGWEATPVLLEPGTRVLLLAGDGGDYAVAVYALATPPAGDPDAAAPRAGAGDPAASPSSSPCRLALIDLRSGTVEHVHPVCTSRDLPTGLAMEDTPGGPVAYLALWSQAAQGAQAGQEEATFAAAGARIVALQARAGLQLDVVPLTGLPRPIPFGGSLLLAPGPTGAGPRLYCVEALPGAEFGSRSEQEYDWLFPMSSAWLLRRLTPEPLQTEETLHLTFAPVGLRVAPGGAHAYAFDARSDELRQIDLTTGQTTVLGRVPSYSPTGLVATRDRLYVASPRANQLWVFDRQRGRRVQVIPTGRRPVWVGQARSAVLPDTTRAKEGP
jgi:hypothetical protein